MDIKDFYTVDEITPALLQGMRRKVEPKQRRILDFAAVDADNDEKIEREVYIEDNRQIANIRGFTDPSIRMQGLETESMIIQPFHVRNYYEYKNNSKFVRKQGGVWNITPEGLRHAIENILEPGRRNLYVYSLLSMANDMQFTYTDEEIGPITIPYTDHIGTLPNPGNWLGGGSFDPYVELRKMKQNFYDLTGQIPNLMILSGAEADDFVALPKVAQKYEPQTPSDPDPSDTTFEEFVFNGMRIVILYDQYPDVDGNLNPAVKAKHALVTVEQVAEDGGPPFRFRKARNQENEGNAAEPYYEVKELSNDPWSGGQFMYDNLIPDVAKRKIVCQWKLKS